MANRRAKVTNESAPSPPSGVGAFGTSAPDPSTPSPPFPPPPPSGPSGDVSQQQRLSSAGDCGWHPAAEGGSGSRGRTVSRKQRTKPAFFFVPGFFFLNLTHTALPSPMRVAGVLLSGWWSFLVFCFLFFFPGGGKGKVTSEDLYFAETRWGWGFLEWGKSSGVRFGDGGLSVLLPHVGCLS